MGHVPSSSLRVVVLLLAACAFDLLAEAYGGHRMWATTNSNKARIAYTTRAVQTTAKTNSSCSKWCAVYAGTSSRGAQCMPKPCAAEIAHGGVDKEHMDLICSLSTLPLH